MTLPAIGEAVERAFQAEGTLRATSLWLEGLGHNQGMGKSMCQSTVESYGA